MRSDFIGTIYHHITKDLIGAVEPDGLASDGFITVADDILVERVEFNQARDVASALGGQKRRAGATKTIKQDLAVFCGIGLTAPFKEK